MRSFIAHQLTSNPKMTFLQVFEWCYDQYVIAATEEDIIENTAKLLDHWSPHEGMEKLVDRFGTGVTCASFAGQEIANHAMVTYFLMVIKKTGKYQCAYEDRVARDDANKTWAHVKDF